MKKRPGFDAMVLALTAMFLLLAGGRFALGSRASDSWRVETEQQAAAAASAEDTAQEDTWPDSLLEGEVIDLNTASQADLERLPGIGAVRAQAIAEDREQNGPFSSVDDLTRVKGIGSATLEGLRRYVTVS